MQSKLNMIVFVSCQQSSYYCRGWLMYSILLRPNYRICRRISIVRGHSSCAL